MEQRTADSAITGTGGKWTPLQHVSPGTMAMPGPERTYLHPGEERVHEKMSMRCECKAFVKIKWNQKKDYWFFERIRLEHNHPLHPSLTITQFLRIQKDKDPIVMGIVDQMHRCDASHNTTVNVLAELYGGRQNFTFTEMDLRNRKATTTREERENDIPKLLEFFREMKAQNEYFYYELQDEQANTFEWLFGAFKNCMSGSRDPRCILIVICNLKYLIKLHTIINHPLTPTEFEPAWNKLVDEYGIWEDDTIQGLWERRKLWVAAYLKPLMTSTQRSESVNKMIKGSSFTGHMTCMSKFARRMLDFIQHTNHIAGGETHWSQSVHTSLITKYRETYIYSTAFHIDPHPNEVDVYLVTHTNQSWQYAWFQHSFRVEADVRSDYIIKRYTRGARTMVTWDRHDIVTSIPGYESDQYKTKKLVEITMAAVRACRKTSLGFKKGCEYWFKKGCLHWLSGVNTGASHVGDHTEEQSDVIPHIIGEPAASWAEQDAAVESAVQISECAPREARTKGRKRGRKQVVNEHASSNKAQGQQTCGYCGSLGHYSTGCDLNPDNINKKRGASGSLRGKMGWKEGENTH
ncbi:hypothetical protein SETIT_9G268900v2 [Setaria italica]|uniref:Protein FAR1-RELATED SEQUENCE n=1 Tax=Setaria italica TaxID=4555 RepID=K4AKF9_SETIT|nr:hypothetical protein SETIT_9G268900v2 [Setaria italica]